MSRIIALILAAVMICFNLSILASCKKDSDDPNKDPSEEEDPPILDDGGDDRLNNIILVPPYKDYGRGTVDFDKLVYKRPDIEGAIEEFKRVIDVVNKNEESYENQLNYIKSLEPIYENVISMNEYAIILLSMNTTSEFWTKENGYFEDNYMYFLHSIEELCIASSQSPHKESFENDYYGEGYLDKYSLGGIYTEEVLEYFVEERKWEAKLLSLSPLNVKISYGGVEDFAQAFIIQYENDATTLNKISKLYDVAYEDESEKIILELVKIRRKIADALGYNSYVEVAYKIHGYTHTPEEMQTFIDNIYDCLAPFYVDYISNVNLTQPLEKNYQRLINMLYGTYENMSEDAFEAYSYMLQHKLYNMASSSDTRLNNSFTSYLSSNNSPFIFINLKNTIADISTISHQFGKFTYYYLNETKPYNEDISEIYAYATELMTYATEHRMFPEDKLRLKFSTITSIIRNVLKNCALASYELQIYALGEEEITKEKLREISDSVNNRIFTATVQEISFTKTGYDFTSSMTNPMSLQLNAVSAIPAFEIFFAELENEGSGVALYNQLLKTGDCTLDSLITTLSLSSPFDEEVIRDIVAKISSHTLGTTPDE